MTDQLIESAKQTVAAITSDPHKALTMHTHQLRIASLMRRIDTVNDTILTERTQHEQWREQMVETVHTYANSTNSGDTWCDIADQAMEVAGIPPRTATEEEVEWSAEVRITVSVDASDQAEAMLAALTGSRHTDHEELECQGEVDLTVSIKVQGSVTAGAGTCVCQGIDEETVLDVTPSWIDEYRDRWEIVNVECDND